MGDKVIYTLQSKKMVAVEVADRPDLPNFVIVCEHGDWSGFRTLYECQSQFGDLENRDKPNGFFSVVER